MPPDPGFGGIDFYEVRELDKYEYNLKLGEINRLVDEDNYEEAATVADTIEWKRVRNIRTLCMISEIYEANDRLEDSKELSLIHISVCLPSGRPMKRFRSFMTFMEEAEITKS